jgi:nitrogen fixation NifU-like protein
MSDLDELYQDLIMDHGRRPRNTGALPEANRHGRGHNPLCGDQLTLALLVEGDVVREARFEGQGCAISTASASLMTQAIKGLPLAEVEALYDRFHLVLTGDGDGDAPELGKLAALSGVRRFPTRVKCATLAWHTLHAALHPEAVSEEATTE